MLEIQDLKRNVNCLLAAAGLRKEEGEQPVRLLLYHLLMTLSMYDNLSADERDAVKKMHKRFKHFFASNFSLKERRECPKKKNSPCTPYKENYTLREDEETLAITAGARESFRQECLSFIGQYDEQQVADFFFYWSEESKNGQMRFEGKKYWNTEKRLKRWVKNHVASDNTSAALRLERLKARQEKDVQSRQAVSEQQAQHAQERQQANDRLERDIEQRKQGAVSYEEFLRMKAVSQQKANDDETG